GIRDRTVTGVQTCALPISRRAQAAGELTGEQDIGELGVAIRAQRRPRAPLARERSRVNAAAAMLGRGGGHYARGRRVAHPLDQRSEERRVGKEGGERRSGK